MQYPVQAGGWYSETPAWLPAARPFLLGSIIFGYLSSAALYLVSARLMHRDLDKLEAVQQAGSLDAVRTSLPGSASEYLFSTQPAS